MTPPKGILVSVGGAEDKGTDLELGIIRRNNLNFFELGILKRIAQLIGGPEARIEVITTASQIPDDVGQNYLSAFAKAGYENVGHLRIRNREDAQREEVVERVRKCDGLMFSGGNQLRLSSIFGGTQVLDILHDRYQDEEFVIGGTSAGAMAMSNTMIYEGSAAFAHLKGEVKITTGLAFVRGVIIDSHFDKRGRFLRLAQAVASNPGAIGIGLGEDTGVIIREGARFECIGSGAVLVIDGHEIDHSNIGDVEIGSPISVEGLKVHIMEHGDTYDVRARTFEPGVEEAEDEMGPVAGSL